MVESKVTKRVVPIPIGQDHLAFKMDSAIMNQMASGGKPPRLTVQSKLCFQPRFSSTIGLE